MKQNWMPTIIAAAILSVAGFAQPANASSAWAHVSRLLDSPSWSASAILFYTPSSISSMPPKYSYSLGDATITFDSYEQNPGPRVYYRCAIVNLSTTPFGYPWQSPQGANMEYYDIQHSSADTFLLKVPTEPRTTPGSFESLQSDTVIWKIQAGLDHHDEYLYAHQDPLSGEE